MANNTEVQRSYMPQLDALRFFAVLGVMVAHNLHPGRLPWLLGDLDWAHLGVRLFFVLSGFLITGILLNCREVKEKDSSRSSWFYFRQFYARRILRIFPIYYIVLGIVFIFDIPPAREIWMWLVTYTTNIYITLTNSWVGRVGHFWTLAVEEQFYLVWPWLVLFLPKRRLVPLILFLIFLAPAYRFYAYQNFSFDIGVQDFKAATFTLSNLDCLGMGALLAIFRRMDISKETLQKYLSRIFLPASLLFYITTLVLYHYRIKPSVFFVFSDLAVAMILVWLVNSASHGFKGVAGKVLEFPPFIYLGKISYGIYVYHYFMPLILTPIFNALGIPYQIPGVLNFFISSLLTIIIASLSWYFIELPINNLKRHFQYLPEPAIQISKAETLVGGG